MALPLTLAFACAQPIGGGPTPSCADGACDEGSAPAVILGAETEWIRCWVDEDTEATDEFFREDYVFCEITPTGRALEIQYASVLLRTAEGGLSEALLQGDAPQALIRRLNGPAYPAEIELSLHLTNFDSDFSYSGVTGDYQTSFSLERSALPTKESPLAFHQPFDLWPLEVLVQTRAVALRMDPYSLDLGSSALRIAEASSLEVTARMQSSARENERFTMLLPVSSEGASVALSGEGTFYRETLPFSVEGAGSFTADDEGLHLVER